MIDNQEKLNSDGVLGRLVNDEGELKEPSHCIIQYGGRVRLPDKLMEILNKEFAPDVMWWQPDGECFAFDSETVQKKILDVWFRGTKLSSFIRSLNRWGFRRVFYHALPEAALAFHHAAFRKTSSPDMLKSMKMSKSGKAAAVRMEAPASASSVAKPLIPSAVASPLAQTSIRLSPLSQVPTVSPGSQSILPQLPLSSGGAARASLSLASNVQQQEALLKLLSEQRSRDILSLAAVGNRASLPASLAGIGAQPSLSSLNTALLLQQGQQQQLLARAEHELLTQQLAQQGIAQQQQQQQRKEMALCMALFNMKARHNP